MVLGKEKICFRKIIQTHFSKRCANNPHYSLRAYARDLGISPASLSQVLAGKQGLSSGKAGQISTKLKLAPDDHQIFMDLVEIESGKNQALKAEAQSRINRILKDSSFQQISEDVFSIVANWYHGAIVELANTRMTFTPKLFSKRLGLKLPVVKQALKRLQTQGFLTANLKPTDQNHIVCDAVSSEAIQKFHGEMIEKSLASLTNQPVEERSFGASILTLDPQKIPEARKVMSEFRKEFIERFSDTSKDAKAYGLSMQLFNLEVKDEP